MRTTRKKAVKKAGQILFLHRNEYTYREISQKLKCSHSTIAKVLNK